jgi:replicative DNA helicase
MRELKNIAKKWDVLIFLICHLVKTKMDEQPTLEDLKGSSSIGQEADTVILLWREMKKEKGQVVLTNNVNISVQANRRSGKTGNIKTVYENGKFLEKEWKSERESQAEEENLKEKEFKQF